MSQTRPLVTIVLPTYNGEQYLSKAIQSIKNQSYKNWELIIVDDCSTDNTNKIAREYESEDNRIRLIKNETNLKLPASLNKGFSNAKGEYYTWTSDDNEYYPEALEKMVEFLEKNTDYGMVYARTNMEKDGKIQPYTWCDQATTAINLLEISVPGACFLYRSNLAKEIGLYDEKLFLNEDHDYWLRIFLKTPIGNLSDILYLYRLTSTGLTNTRKLEIGRGKIKLLRHYRGIYAEIFPEVKEYYHDNLLFDKFIEGEIDWKTCKQMSKNKKILWKALKKEYIYCGQNHKYINYIKSLGILYFFKAIILENTTKI